MGKIKNAALAAVMAVVLLLGGLFVSAPEEAAAHTYYSQIKCGSSVSPYGGQIQVAYHYGYEPWHRYYWRYMTAGEYWTYCW